jgi:exodeoxyribonuclease-3
MKIISYNVNGLRAAIKKGFMDWLRAARPDVLCLQEIKAHEHQLELQLFEDEGYVYHHWFPAQKKGYSGVAILSREKPRHVEFGTGLDHMDAEGRNLRVDFDELSVMSLYLPSGTNDDRLQFKLDYMDEFQDYVNDLKKELPRLVICGDYNICHEAIDIHNPVQNKNTSGFLPVEREWIGNFIKSGFIDTFRHLNKDPHHYSWWSYRANARNNNKGWRIDYCMASEALEPHIERAFILPEARHSDHCPVGVQFAF